MLWIENQMQSECWDYHWDDKVFQYNCCNIKCKYYCRENCFESNKNMHYLYALLTDNKIHLYMMSTTNLLILFCVRIEVKRVKRSQFDAVWTMLERCVIRKVIVQSFHSRDNISSNSHNQSTKKINDMSMSVRDEKILLVKKTTQMKSLRVVTTSDRRICDSSTASISKRLHHIDSVIK